MTTKKTLAQILNDMWKDYCNLNPAALKIYELLTQQGEIILNDHVAYRTFNHPRLGIKSLAQHFESWGYKESNDYTFVEKKLYAKHYQHPDSQLPKIFISELQLEKVSSLIQSEAEKLVSQVPDSLIQSEDFVIGGRPWAVAHSTYEKLAAESEYASWVAAFGFRPNHFTVNINALKNFSQVAEINTFLKSKGIVLNSSGGEVKGTAADFLEQSSTMAEEVPVKFTDGTFLVPACYYEFAKRHLLPNGQLYQGFVTKSADKIFESTDRIK
ncbi:MAG: DUF1338 domain-containing protein [Pseudobdellovibrionaceae bacterium]